MHRIEIFTDGACSGNPGAGGWGAILRCKNTEKELSGGEAQTTNNRMELTAVIEALKALKAPCDITLYTDSRYVMDGVTSWLANWKSNGWKTANKKAPGFRREFFCCRFIKVQAFFRARGASRASTRLVRARPRRPRSRGSSIRAIPQTPLKLKAMTAAVTRPVHRP